jgi:alpha-mannosidase
MPADTFRWRGIDGSEINTHFLTAQKLDRNPTARRTTYVANTNAQMVAGAYKRYGQKDIHNEALLTFGYGDGGGGPTAEMLELARRGAHGVPGSPNVSIEFAGDYLDRLAAKMENNPAVPRWQGELYLEFHRGTYTTIARNKRNNRKCEFLYLGAELMGVLGKHLLDRPFPADKLHYGWENILTNQFHDIIPGSSIKEVYDQCDIDYAMIRDIGETVVNDTRAAIADGIAAERGWVVFNPTSFAGDGMVQIDGKTALVQGIPAKGYRAVKEFVTENHVRIDGRTVENDCLRVTFDDSWQMTSIYDKANDRELLVPGAVGNELRIFELQPLEVVVISIGMAI